ncbi:MAG: T9SS type A sorting domain-containing protein [Bacteroidetes bacterium]|nr:T9SS type A sorting domain-containing protein [Bacteroidota bacterium]
MKKFTYILFTLAFVSSMAFSLSSFAVKHVVSVGNFFFSPATVSVNVGDTMRWVWSEGTHTTTSTPGAIPSGAASWDAPITSTATSFEYKVTKAGSYAYVCTPHAPGMAGSFTATAVAPTLSVTPPGRNVNASAGATTFTVASNSQWTASSNAAWCTVTASGTGNGTINANYSENTSFAQRVATITVTVTGLTPQLVTVTQAASTVGVAEQLLTDLQVFPNPTKGVFKFRAGRIMDQVLEVSVMDISGKKILSRVCSGSEEYTFDISREPKGYYFIRIISGNSTQVRRIVLTD